MRLVAVHVLLLWPTRAEDDPPDFSSRDYWDQRYSREAAGSTYEWYQGWPGLSTILSKYIRKEDRILVLGAGTSPLSEDMHTAGYNRVWSTDVSPTAVQRMLSRWEQLGFPSGRWVELDVRNMSQHFAKSSFDATLEKGLMDAVLSGQSFQANLELMLQEVEHVLRPGGVHLVVSSCMPMVCQHQLQLDGRWNVAVEKVHKAWLKPEQRGDVPRDTAADFIYVCSPALAGDAAPIREPAGEPETSEPRLEV